AGSVASGRQVPSLWISTRTAEIDVAGPPAATSSVDPARTGVAGALLASAMEPGAGASVVARPVARPRGAGGGTTSGDGTTSARTAAETGPDVEPSTATTRYHAIAPSGGDWSVNMVPATVASGSKGPAASSARSTR